MLCQLLRCIIFVFHITRFTINTWLQILMKICERCSDEQGCENEKIVFILDESNILESSFLERMNSLLANGEVKIYRYILWIEIYGRGGFNALLL